MERTDTQPTAEFTSLERIAQLANSANALRSEAEQLKNDVDPELGPAIGMIERSLGEAAAMGSYLSQKLKPSGT